MFQYNLKRLRKENGYTMESLAEAYNKKFDGKMNKSTVSRYENGLQEPMYTVVKNLAEMFGVSIDSITGKEPTEQKSCGNCHDEQTEELLCNYNKLNNKGKHELRKRAEELTEIKRYLKEETAQEFYIDFMDIPASAGTGVFLTEEYKSTIAVKDTCMARRASFALRVSGDSMEPQYNDGDIVFVKSAPKIEIGEIGIFVLNGNGYIKKLGNRRLISLNPKYKDITFGEGDSIVCVGKVIGKEE